MGGGQQADGTTRDDGQARETSWLPLPPPPPAAPPGPPAPPQPARRPGQPLVKPVVLIAAAAVLAVLVGAAAIAVFVLPPDDLQAEGAPIYNAKPALHSAEDMVEWELESGEAEYGAAAVDKVSCWFAYADGEDSPEDDLWCGPVMYADSAPGTHWLKVPVGFSRERGRMMASAGMVESRRTFAQPEDLDLRRPDGRSAPDEDDIDLERPDAEHAASGTVAVMATDQVMVDLDAPDDGAVVGVGYRWDVVGTGSAERAYTGASPGERATALAAADNEEWLLFEVTGEPTGNAMDPPDPAFTVVVDGEQRVPVSDHVEVGAGENVVAVSVPADAEDVALEVNDGVVAQTWSFTDETRSGAPQVLYRDEEDRVAQVGQDFTLPYSVRDLNPIAPLAPADFGEYGYVPGFPGHDMSRPFGELSADLHVGVARLDYAMEVSAEPWPDTTYLGAGAPDRALLYLTDIDVNWSELGYAGYLIPPEDAVLTLPDGSQIPATRVGTAQTSIIDFGLNASGLGNGTDLYWNVPADFEQGTITLTFLAQEDGLYELDFQGATVTFDVEFG